ncbi:MAG: Cdc6/Cdc18 family protein [Promethearchaeota archaeon]
MSKNNEDGIYTFDIDKFYKSYLNGPRIFKNREALEPSFVPDELPHRDKEIERIAGLTACALRGDIPPNFLCYGMTGTGKTATIRYISQKLARHCSTKPPWWIYINCNVVSTPYRVLAHIYNTGLLDNCIKEGICFLVLDEIDILIEKKGSNEILYDLTRLNENLDSCRVSIIGISNKLKFLEYLDPRVKSSLGQEEIVFHPYNANELADILLERAKIAFYPNIVNEGILKLVAGLAAKEHGDARKALQLLRKAGEMAEMNKHAKITESDIYKAQKDIEKDHIVEYILGLPLQAQLTLIAIYLLTKYSKDHIITSGDIYEVHSELSKKIPGVKELTRRRISDYINELNLAGLINTSTRSMGYYGRTKIINLDIDVKLLGQILKQVDRIRISDLLNYKPILLQSDKVKIKNNVFKRLL